MVKRKIECVNGWIVFIVNNHEVIQVHSTGAVTSGYDDRGPEADLLFNLEHDAYENKLHSQAPGGCGIRWPQDNLTY